MCTIYYNLYVCACVMLRKAVVGETGPGQVDCDTHFFAAQNGVRTRRLNSTVTPNFFL